MVETQHRPGGDPASWSGVRIGPLAPGDRVTLSDPKGRQHSVLLAAGEQFHTAKGAIAHDDLIGGPEGVVVTSSGGVAYLALRPLLRDVTVKMPRGAAVIYPKDAAQILTGADIFPRPGPRGRRRLGALALQLLRRSDQVLDPNERREDFAAIDRRSEASSAVPTGLAPIGDLVDSLRRERAPASVVVVLKMRALGVSIRPARRPAGARRGVCCTYHTTPLHERSRPQGDTGSPRRTNRRRVLRALHEGPRVRRKHAIRHTGSVSPRWRTRRCHTLRKNRPAPARRRGLSGRR